MFLPKNGSLNCEFAMHSGPDARYDGTAADGLKSGRTARGQFGTEYFGPVKKNIETVFGSNKLLN